MLIPNEARVALTAAVRRASSSEERAAHLAAYATAWQVSEATARRHAGVKIRAASPAPAATMTDPGLDQVVGLWLSSATEKYTHATMPLADVIDMAEVAGVIAPGQVTLARLWRYIREHRITLNDQRRGTPHVWLRTEHPNHAHLADVTRCRQWYLRDDGRLDAQSFKRGTAAYRNKDLRRGVTLYRYVLVDHTSGLPYVQYHTDETVPTLLTFLAGAWLPKRQRQGVSTTGAPRWQPAPFDPEQYEAWAALPPLRDYPFRGAPRLLVLDRAGANQAEFTAQLCERLGIKLIIASEARAKGAVEAMMWIWERKFEARLALQPACDLATLNAWALDFSTYWCRKAIHSRHGMTRTQAWATIRPEQLREIPAWPIFQELARREPELRTVKSGPAGFGVIYHEGAAWLLPNASLIGQRVAVSYSVFHREQLEARAEDGQVYLMERLARDRWGFYAEAPVLGETFARHADSPTQQTQKRLEAVRAALPALEVFGREGEKTDVPAILGPREGVQISLRAEVDAREISAGQFTRRVRAALGDRALTEAEGAERDRVLAGRASVPEALVETFVAWCLAQTAPASPKVVNLFR